MHLKADFKDFVASLNAAGVEYVVVGAYAVAFHGIPRFTGDIDFFVAPSRENGEKIVECLRAFGLGALNLTPDDFVDPDRVIQLGVAPNRIDLLTGIEAVSFADVYARRAQTEIDGLQISFISREDLIRNKRATGRPQDAADVARLEAL